MPEEIRFSPNRVRRKLKDGKSVSGSVIYSMSPSMMHAAGWSGLDFIRIDNEHQWNRDESMAYIIQTGNALGVETLLRVDRDEPYVPRKALELGAGGVIFPQLVSAKEVAEHVKFTKFPPKGARGYSSACWAGGWGTKTGNAYVEWSDSEPMIGIMIENASAADHVEEMMAVEGVDFALFGPADLSMSLGYRRPNQADAKVQAALANTIKAARKFGKHVMFDTGTNPDDIRHWHERGITMFELDHDLSIVRSVWRDRAKLVGEL